jgi:hypothetical protein
MQDTLSPFDAQTRWFTRNVGKSPTGAALKLGTIVHEVISAMLERGFLIVTDVKVDCSPIAIPLSFTKHSDLKLILTVEIPTPEVVLQDLDIPQAVADLLVRIGTSQSGRYTLLPVSFDCDPRGEDPEEDPDSWDSRERDRFGYDPK